MKRTNINYAAEGNTVTVKPGFTAKVVAATTAAVLAIGIPVSFGLSRISRNAQAEASPFAAETTSAVEMTVPTAAAGASKDSDETVLELTKTEQKKESKKTKKAKKTTKTKKAKKAASKKTAQTAAQEIELPETIIPVDNNVPKYEEPAPAAEQQMVNTDTFVDQMLSMSSSQLRALSGNDYEIVESLHTQAPQFGIRCTAFPDYVFVPEQCNEFSDLYQETADSVIAPVVYPDGTGYNMMLGENIKQLELTGSAQIGNGAYVGMRYNDLEYALGQNFYMTTVGSSLELAAGAKIEGRSWLLHFSLTEEQKAEVISRIRENDLYTMTDDGEKVCIESGCVDISDLNPVCDMAVLEVYY